MKTYRQKKRRGRSLFFLLFFFTGYAFPAAAQQYSYKQYTVDDGLPTNAIYGGLQDSRGYIWFYTEKGVSRFDGYSFRNFTVKDGLPTNDIFMLTEDTQGRLWVHSYGRKLVLIEGDSTILIAEDTSRNFFRFTIYSDDSRVWFVDGGRKMHISENGAGFDTLFIRERAQQILQRIKGTGVFYNFKWDTLLCFDPELAHILATDGKGNILSEFPLDGLDKPLARALSSNTHSSYETFGNGIFIRPYSDSTLYYVDIGQKRIKPINLAAIFGSAPEFVRYYRQDGQIQVQTNVGVYILDEALQPVDTFKVAFPSTVRIDRIFKDREGNYWITSRQKGVFFLTAEERNAWIIPSPAREDNAIACLEGDGHGNIFAGTKKGSIYQLIGGAQLQPLLSAPSAQYNDIVETKAIAATSDGLWISRQSIGLEYYDFRTGRLRPFTKYLEKAELINDYGQEQYYRYFGQGVLHLFAKGLAWDEKGQQLAAARGKYPFVCHLQENERPLLQILSSRRTHAVDFGPDGAIWLGHSDGLGRYFKGEYHYYGHDPLLGKSNIRDVAACSEGNVWIGTDGFGLFVFSEGKAIPVRGTANDIIQDVFVEPAGKVWIATNQGVKSIVPSTPLDSSYVGQVLTTNNGLPTIEANAVLADENFVYVGTDAGLTVIGRPLSYEDNTPPKLILEQVRINGLPAPIQNSYELAYGQNELEVDFTGLSFKSFGRLRYEYQLTGADRAPQSTQSRSARYSGLQPGQYTFSVRAFDIKGNASAGSIPMVFTIHPPWWRSTAGMIGLAALAILAIAGLFRWRIAIVRRKAREKSEIDRKFAELELQALQSQMNPHFVFNSLGAIQYFIQNNEKKQADRYLSKFAYLMRLFLESSKNKYISLEEELTLIRLYVELEQLRFKGRFDFELSVSENINPHTAMLPAMLLQPFVENAINHGLFHKEGPGRLKLSVSPVIKGGLQFVIEDDGVGRKRAEELRRQSDKNYKSRALEITGERLKTIRKAEGYDIAIRIEDLFDESGQASGTRVQIEVPEID